MGYQTVHLFVFDTLSDWEASYAIAGINNPVYQIHPARYRVQTVSLGKDPVTTIGGIRLQPDMALPALRPSHSAMLILIGGAAWDEGKNSEAAEAARTFLAEGVPVAAICGATAGLARVGLLDNKRHTSNALDYLAATNYSGQRFYRDAPAVTDGDLITAGATAPIDFAYHIFKRLDLYKAETLDAWYGLFKTGKPAYYAALLKSSADRAHQR